MGEIHLLTVVLAVASVTLVVGAAVALAAMAWSVRGDDDD